MIIVTCGLFSCAVVFVLCAQDSLVTKNRFFLVVSGEVVRAMASNGVHNKVISAQCPECQSGANSNKRGCGPPVKAQAQATARVDVPTARVFPVWTKESNTSASFCCERLDMCTAGNRP